MWCVLLLKGLFTRNQEQGWQLQERRSDHILTLSPRELDWVWLGLTHRGSQGTLTAKHGFYGKTEESRLWEMSWFLLGQNHTFLGEKEEDIPTPFRRGQSWWTWTKVSTYSFFSWPEAIWEPGFQLGDTGQGATWKREEMWSLPYGVWVGGRKEPPESEAEHLDIDHL